MKKLFIGGMLLASIAAFAGTCTLQHFQLTKIGTHDTFAGEIHNDTGVNFLGHKILVAFFDSNGAIVEQKTVTPCLRSAQDGAFTFFSVASSESSSATSAGLARFVFDGSLEIGDAETGDVAISNLVITRVNRTTLRVKGKIKNNDATTLADPNICAVVYSSAGKVVVVGQQTSMPSLVENETDNIEISVTVPDSTANVDHVDVWADGLKDGVPIAPESDLDNSVTVCTPTATATPTGSSTATPTDTPTPAAPTATNTNTPTATATSICS